MRTKRGSFIRSGGTWALPKTEREATELIAYLATLGDHELHRTEDVQDKLYGVFGDDMLFDALGGAPALNGFMVKKIVNSRLMNLWPELRDSQAQLELPIKVAELFQGLIEQYGGVG